MHAGAVCLPRPPGPQGRVPQAVDPAHQRRLPGERHQLQPVHQRPEGGRDRGRPQGPGRSGRARRRCVHRVDQGCRPGDRVSGRSRLRRRRRADLAQPVQPRTQATAAPVGRRSSRSAEGRVRRARARRSSRKPSRCGHRGRGVFAEAAGMTAAARVRPGIGRPVHEVADGGLRKVLDVVEPQDLRGGGPPPSRHARRPRVGHRARSRAARGARRRSGIPETPAP